MESTDALLVGHAERLSRLEGIAEHLNKMLETFGAEVRDQRARANEQFYTLICDDAFYGWFGSSGIDEIVGLFEAKSKATAALKAPGF